MAGVFNLLGWLIIVVGFLIAFFTIAMDATTNNLVIGLGMIVGSILVAAPFFALGEVLQRLEQLQALQDRSNEISVAILKTLRSQFGHLDR